MTTTASTTPLAALGQRLAPLRSRLLEHPVYASLHDLADLRRFLRLHVFAVWDFMSLLKALQRHLTSIDAVWRPVGDPAARRLINEIVVGEESDLVDGSCVSHFELYRQAMLELGASTAEIDAVLADVGRGVDVDVALRHAPPAAQAFSTTTFAIVRSGSLPAIAAAFTLGREDVIPAMFTRFVRDLDGIDGVRTGTLVRYLERHIELDGDEHGPMAVRLLADVCGDDARSWVAAEQAARSSLEARIALWDGVVAATGRQPTSHAIS